MLDFDWLKALLFHDKMKGEIIDTRMDFIFDTFILSSVEYAKIVSEINTNYGKYEGIKFGIHASYGLDNMAYLYYFENHGYNDYNIYARIEIGG